MESLSLTLVMREEGRVGGGMVNGGQALETTFSVTEFSSLTVLVTFLTIPTLPFIGDVPLLSL